MQRLCLAVFLLLTCLTSAQVPPPSALERGVVLEHVACKDDSSQSYALYLPSGYNESKKWPIVYAFDPLGRGPVPAGFYKDVAEKYGFIFVASNNARNFSATDSDNGTRAMWRDTHERFSLDERRIYTTGFSGGARMAGNLALACGPCQIAGVIAHGAGYPVNLHPADKNGPAYFLAVGDADFNWQEIMRVRQQREELGMPYRVEVFQGPHRWAPAEVFDHAMRWMQLKAMQHGWTPRDETFLDTFHREEEDRAAQAEKQGDALAELAALRALASDFEGLRDTADDQRKLSALKSSHALKDAIKKENEQIAAQAELSGEIDAGLARLEDAGGVAERVSQSSAIADEIRRLKVTGGHGANQLVRQRAYAEVRANAIEHGQARFETRNYERAELYFALIAEVDDEPWSKVLLAETRLALGNKKGAVTALRAAVRAGLSNAQALEDDKKLEALRGDAEFAKLLAEMKVAR